MSNGKHCDQTMSMGDEADNQVFLEKMARYTRSMNEVPVDRVSIPTADLLRLINMATSQQALFKVRTDWIPPFSKERM